jgi:malic enzyme
MDRYHTPGASGTGSGRRAVEVPYRGAALLRHPMFNKGTAFTHQERATFGLEGLLPAAVNSLDQQSWRVYGNLMRKADPLERYVGLMALQDRNEHLFYRVLLDHPEELLPVVYGPVLERACREFSQVFRRGRGLWITPEHRGRIESILRNAPFEDVRLVVATDNAQVLGLGDQGAGGMAAAVGRLALYTVAAGIHPTRILPVSLDVGTDNPALLDDELYLGWRYPRLRGAEYESLVDEFVRAARRRFPEAVLAWEGLAARSAFRLLDRYQRVVPCFNDEGQSLPAVALAAVLAAQRLSGRRLEDERFLVLGESTTGIGAVRLLRHALRSGGLGTRELRRAVAVVDHDGLLVAGASSAGPSADPYRREAAWPPDLAEAEGLPPGRRRVQDVVKALRPTVILEASRAATPRPEMGPDTAEPPLVVPLFDGHPANAALVSPGISLGAMVGRVREVTEGMFLAAARALAALPSEDDLRAGRLLPGVHELRRVAGDIAQAVLREAELLAPALPAGARYA